MKMITRNFSEQEMGCKCNYSDCKAFMNRSFMNRLQLLRDNLGFPLRITSGARCQKHNKDVGGAKYSRHQSDGVYGSIAADIFCLDGERKLEILKEALRLGFAGVGIQKNFIHLDSRPHDEASLWTYS